MRSYGSSASGLQCSWGSDLDTRIPRPKCPKSALPDSVRQSLGLAKRKSSKRYADEFIPDSAVHSTKGGQLAKNFTKMKSGVPMSTRTAGLQKQVGGSASYAKMQEDYARSNQMEGYQVHQKHDRQRIELKQQEFRQKQIVPHNTRRQKYDRSAYGAGKTNMQQRGCFNVSSNQVGLGEIENIPNPNNRRQSIEQARKNANSSGQWR